MTSTFKTDSLKLKAFSGIRSPAPHYYVVTGLTGKQAKESIDYPTEIGAQNCNLKEKRIWRVDKTKRTPTGKFKRSRVCVKTRLITVGCKTRSVTEMVANAYAKGREDGYKAGRHAGRLQVSHAIIELLKQGIDQ